jgi:hypothetical protein
MNLSTDGYMAETDVALEIGANVWLKLPGLEAQNSWVMWAEEGKAGFKFAAPLHQATVDMLIEKDRKPIVKGHFGPQGGARR